MALQQENARALQVELVDEVLIVNEMGGARLKRQAGAQVHANIGLAAQIKVRIDPAFELPMTRTQVDKNFAAHYIAHTARALRPAHSSCEI